MTRASAAWIFASSMAAAVAFGAGPVFAQCPLDCDGGGTIDVGELATGVEIGLLRLAPAACAADPSPVTVERLVEAAAARLGPCRPEATATPTPTPTPTPSALPTATGTPCADGVPPTSAAALLAWLQDGSYRGWCGESSIHASRGPHFGRVRTYLNATVFDSLAAGSAQHPQGAALVKELYGPSGGGVRGWAVMVKTQPDSAGGQGWYWYERYDTSLFAAGNGVALCSNCHRADYNGLTARDHVLTPYPLE